MTYPFGGSSWTGLSDATFGEVLEKLMPIPQAEKDRLRPGERARKRLRRTEASFHPGIADAALIAKTGPVFHCTQAWFDDHVRT